MFSRHIKIQILFCLLIVTASAQAADNSRLNQLLQKAKARRSAVKKEADYAPVPSKEIKQETIPTTQSVPKPEEKSYDDLVGEFNELFDETKTQIKEHKKPEAIQKPVQEATYVKEKPKKIIKTTARPDPVPPAVKKETTQVKVETKKTVTQTTAKTQSTAESKIETPKKAAPKIIEVDHEEEEELDEDEYEQEHHHEHETEDEEELELDQDEGLAEMPEDHGINADDMPEERKVINKNMVVPKTQAERMALYLDIVKKSLKSLEEDAWNEVKFNMSESLKFFEKEKTIYNATPIEKFHEITLAFFRFSEGGLELDQGDFADFEDAEAHYLDSQDILDDVELKLKAKDTTDQELLKIIQTVKKYINEDIEYIEEMIDLS